MLSTTDHRGVDDNFDEDKLSIIDRRAITQLFNTIIIPLLLLLLLCIAQLS